jgi:CRISPR-associated exonuclease Cas4
MLIFVFFLIALAVFLFWQARRKRQAAGLPGGRIIYSDTRGWGPVEEPLYDPELGLAGRPDYLVRDGDQVIPVEVKSGRNIESPYDSHIFQLAAYCRLVESAYGQRPDYGLLHYSEGDAFGKGRTFAIDYTPELESALLEVIEEMRAQERRKNVDRSHDTPARCRSCGFRSVCDQRLA